MLCYSFMDDAIGKIKVIPDHFKASTTSVDSHQNRTSSLSQQSDKFLEHSSHSWTRRQLRSAAFMLNMFSFKGLAWGSSTNGQEKVELSKAEVESLRSELADLEEREAHLKAQLEHVDEILRSARLSGYLYIRTRWTALPGEPPPLDDTDVDDWLPRFTVLHGPCIFFYLLSTDLSPQDSTLLSDIVEIGPLPSFTREDEGTRYAFYVLTRQGLRYECSSISKTQVDSWLSALQTDCKSGSGTTAPNGLTETKVMQELLEQKDGINYAIPEEQALLGFSFLSVNDQTTFSQSTKKIRLRTVSDFRVGFDLTTKKETQSPSHTSYLFLSLSLSRFHSFLTSLLSFQRRTSIPELQVIPKLPKMTSQILRSVSKATRSLLSASKGSRFYSEGRAVAAVAAMSLRGTVPFLASNYGKAGSENMTREWISGALAVSAAAYMLQEQEAHAAENERTFIAIKPDGVQRGLIAEIISRFERKGFKLVAIKIVVPSKGFAEKHYHDLKERPFFNGLCDFLSSGPVIAMVWEGEGVIKYGRKLIGATDPQKSEPGTIRGDLAVVVGRNIIHGSDGLETAKDEINLWFKPEELVTYTSNSEKWVYGAN
ncbi:uncharacterized protein LOC133854542 [Alnus glutinosa]|uniref:uncharacterized protein LOC133854542 n=1 Tax=Alnus glutinosa TaxID=3517 RepID=UPI002D787406|nr:uncharacterized protein LOC133854542 [Alnus glutinosa]